MVFSNQILEENEVKATALALPQLYGAFSIVRTDAESRLVKVLGTLGNRDAIKILRSARNGLEARTDTYKELGISVKRYYYRLGRLMDAGLVTKMNNRYELTPLGVTVCNSVETRILWAIENVGSEDRIHIAFMGSPLLPIQATCPCGEITRFDPEEIKEMAEKIERTGFCQAECKCGKILSLGKDEVGRYIQGASSITIGKDL